MISALLCIFDCCRPLSFEECLALSLPEAAEAHQDRNPQPRGPQRWEPCFLPLWPLVQFITLSQRFKDNRRDLGKEEKEGGRGRHND